MNNVTYNRYAESGRIAWVQKYARTIDPEHKRVWEELGTPRGEVGMILRKITTEFKFVSFSPFLLDLCWEGRGTYVYMCEWREAY